ncbi:MAG: hypothetical protein EHM28_07885 [Spirochaetaceae bacterium]|nr:MAG: hypothetical protein EHM28_07885 [Spirochaetaceae bacterium]
MPNGRITIDKKYVHKFNEENVFLCNLRRILPLTIEKGLFENHIRNSVPEEDYGRLKKYYVLAAHGAEDKKDGGETEYYAIRYYPVIKKLSVSDYDMLVSEKNAAWEKELIDSLYCKEKCGESWYYRLKEAITEPFDNFLLCALKRWDLFINSEERTFLSEILEKCVEIRRQGIFFANMFVNTCHPFFFEHPNEHVPAIMLIETVRQFLLACSHRYGNVPLEDSQIIVNYMNSKFMNYININFPVLFKSTTKDLKVNRHGYWQYQQVHAEVFQGHKRMAEFTFDGNCISSQLFQRIRRNQITELRKSRFVPMANAEYHLEIRHEGGKRAVTATLVNVSLEGILLKVRKEDYSDVDGIIDLMIFYGKEKMISGRYCKIWNGEHGDHMVIGCKSHELAENALKTLYELISRECMVMEKREFI